MLMHYAVHIPHSTGITELLELKEMRIMVMDHVASPEG